MVEIIRTASHGAAVAITALGVAALGLAAAPVAVRAQPVSPVAVVDAFEKAIMYLTNTALAARIFVKEIARVPLVRPLLP